MIPISKPYITQREREFFIDAFDSGWISSLGPYIDKLQTEFAKFCGTKYAIAVSNGTVGLHLALVALDIKCGDEIIVPDLTFVASANTVKHAGAIPVFADIDKDNYCISPSSIRSLITNKTKAIMPVHLYGFPCNMDEILGIAQEYNLSVIEDCAEAHGAQFNSKKVGSFGDLGVFSFYGNKIITTGEGGIITTNNRTLYEKCLHLRDHAMSKEIKYWHTEVGYNYRMTNPQAAIGLAQLQNIDFLIDERDKILSIYHNYLSGRFFKLNYYSPEFINTNNIRPVNWLTCLTIDNFTRSDRDNLINLLKNDGIDTRPFFFPVSELPMYLECNSSNLNADLVSSNSLNLPTFIGITEDQIRFICDRIIHHHSLINK